VLKKKKGRKKWDNVKNIGKSVEKFDKILLKRKRKHRKS